MLSPKVIISLLAVLFCCCNNYTEQDKAIESDTDNNFEITKDTLPTAKKFPAYSLYGIDVSHYQGEIDWDLLLDTYNIDFVMVRVGTGHSDPQRAERNFSKNWNALAEKKIAKGAYYAFYPNVGAEKQAQYFIDSVKLTTGDLPPVIDVERADRNSSKLMDDVYKWLQIIEAHYGVKPIIYTGSNFYGKHFKDDNRFADYPLWIANYSQPEGSTFSIGPQMKFWQISDKDSLAGIEANVVDVDAFCGTPEEMEALLIK